MRTKTNHQLEPTVFVIFGGAGDLTWRKLIPSLFDLHRDGRMPRKFAIIAVDRASFRDANLHKRLLDGVKRFSRSANVKNADWKNFASHITYQPGDFKDPATYSKLEKSCAELDEDWKVKAGHVFHMATPPVVRELFLHPTTAIADHSDIVQSKCRLVLKEIHEIAFVEN